jgi:FKBP-type peptidyl-prolyl cis-trans isomerase
MPDSYNMRFTKIFALGALVALSMNGVAAEEELKAPMDGVQEAKITLTKDFIPADCTAEAKKSKAGNYLHVHYTGFIDESSATGEKGKKFDSSLEGEKPEPFTFSLGEGQVVAGLYQNLLGGFLNCVV